MQQAPHDRQGLSLLSLMVSAYEDAMVTRQRLAEKPQLCNGKCWCGDPDQVLPVVIICDFFVLAIRYAAAMTLKQEKSNGGLVLRVVRKR